MFRTCLMLAIAAVLVAYYSHRLTLLIHRRRRAQGLW